jgi:hypothetical protein
MKDFVVPKVDTKVIGKPGFEYAFQIRAQLDPAHETKTTRGGRYFQGIASGQVSGPRLNGTVYPDSGGAYSFVARDGVHELNSRFMIRAADTGEWIYVEHRGYRRKDGYHRIQAQFDADKQGKYASLNGNLWLAIAEESRDGREVTFTYFEVV